MQQLFDWLADGVSLDEFIKDFRIDRTVAALSCARAAHNSAVNGRQV